MATRKIGDAFKKIPQLADDTVQLFIFSPPYSLTKEKDQPSTLWSECPDFCDALLELMKRYNLLTKEARRRF
jgi:hypothetical protein